MRDREEFSTFEITFVLRGGRLHRQYVTREARWVLSPKEKTEMWEAICAAYGYAVEDLLTVQLEKAVRCVMCGEPSLGIWRGCAQPVCSSECSGAVEERKTLDPNPPQKDRIAQLDAAMDRADLAITRADELIRKHS